MATGKSIKQRCLWSYKQYTTENMHAKDQQWNQKEVQVSITLIQVYWL